MFDPWTVLVSFSVFFPLITYDLCPLLTSTAKGRFKGRLFVVLAQVQSFELETEKRCCAACFCDIEKGINILKSKEKDRHPVFCSRQGP